MQVGVAAHLIQDLGWPVQQVAIEAHADQTFDVGAYVQRGGGQVMCVAAEVKTLRSQPSLERMVDQIQAACETKLAEHMLDLRRDVHK